MRTKRLKNNGYKENKQSEKVRRNRETAGGGNTNCMYRRGKNVRAVGELHVRKRWETGKENREGSRRTRFWVRRCVKDKAGEKKA